MKVRVGTELAGLLRRARENCGTGAGDILRKARLRSARLRPDLTDVESVCDARGTVVTLRELPGESAEGLRKLMLWYLRGVNLDPPRARFVTALVEGRDYLVE